MSVVRISRSRFVDVGVVILALWLIGAFFLPGTLDRAETASAYAHWLHERTPANYDAWQKEARITQWENLGVNLILLSPVALVGGGLLLFGACRKKTSPQTPVSIQ